MRICFVWVAEFRNFENFGFNLANSFKFKYDVKENKLTMKPVNMLPKDFFGEKIIDVVGIVGKNGAGKSNAVELVCKMLKGAKTSIQTDFFIITEQDENFTCHVSFSDGIKPKSDFKVKFEKYDGYVNPLKVVFFSNVFDERMYDFDSEVSDISVNYLHKRSMFHSKNSVSDFEKQIKLINSKVFPSLNIEVPTKILITLKNWHIRFNSVYESEMYGELYDDIKEFRKIFRERIREIKPENKFIHLLKFGYFFEWMRKVFRRSQFQQNDTRHLLVQLKEFFPTIINLRTEEVSQRLIDFLSENFSNTKFEQPTLFILEDKVPDATTKKVINQLHFLKNLKNTLGNQNLEYNSEGSRNREIENFIFDYKSLKNKDFISDLISLFGDGQLFTTNWLGISSGHKAYLNLFSSLFQELKFRRQPNLLLCIDEGDLYLHPKWQIEFFDKLISTLPEIYSGNIQLVLTSHSPFLLSDLPNQNITILDKSIDGSSLDGIDLPTNTFGGNLYDLYSEPFFLGNKRTSDFAYNKIKTAIELTEKQKLTRLEKISLKQISRILGDEIIQFRITKFLKND